MFHFKLHGVIVEKLIVLLTVFVLNWLLATEQ